jgi:TolB protein
MKMGDLNDKSAGYTGLFIFLVLIFISFKPTVSFGQEMGFIPIEIKSRTIRVAVPDFRPNGDISSGDVAIKNLTGFMREMVLISGMFELVPPEAYPTPVIDSKKENYSAWKLINTDYLIRGDVARLTGGRYQVEFRCFSVSQGKMVLGKRYTGESELFNRMTMKFMDELLNWLSPSKGMGALDSKIAYASDVTGRNEIRIMDTDGSHNEPLTTNRTLNLSPAWSPDGRYLVYTGYKNRNPDLYIWDKIKGKEMRFFSQAGLNQSAEFSPDGRNIAFSREGKDGNIDIYIIGTNGKNLRRVTNSRANEVSPSWSPDGNFVAFLSDRTGTPQVYMLNINKGPEKSGNSSIRLSREGSYNSSPAWSPDGRWIAYTGRMGGQFDLFLIDMKANGSPVRRLTATVCNEENPSWSPDSRFLVYDSNKYGNYDIYIMSIYGGTPKRITRGPAKERMPAWSPREQQR